MNLFDLSLKLNGFPLRQAKIKLDQTQKLEDDAFESYLQKQKKDIVTYHLEHNPFYKQLSQNVDPNHWESLPVLTKKDLQQPLEKRLSKGFTAKNVYVNKTSGSSGDPFIFAKDKFCHAMTWAVIQNRFGWYGLDFNVSKQARFYGIPLDKKGYYKERFKDWLSSRYRFSVFDLSDNALRLCLKRFKETPFDYINGYTSSILQFAKFLNKEGLILKSICPSLKACMVTSEMLFEEDKLIMEASFGIPIINEYGASELDLIAFQNPNNEWLLNNETLFVEILNDENKPAKPNEEGKIVITSLYNKAHPFIRYEIGDLGILSGESSCKKPILKKLIGRTNDMVVLPSGKKAAGLTFYYVTKTIIENDGNVKEFVVDQMSPNTFKIKYESTKDLSQETKQNIVFQLETYLEKGLSIQFERKEKIKRTKSGKLKQFTSLVK
ncbi:phenylacetate--CoA ligase family protein [Mangrovimonas sp. AS39]|uniref:phenylacetate--CoA ligase family protein n=1 Tax=Mangrovimonas futianensis TaxID=2895523 RepID=UPI001E2A06C5|nr:phenylacetate--CoA ligase family protein [Mangrovimonas futianensis]MCF1190309.1 phenylacetate--CoA ligase family protein [Mangrovimonas futianensis]MCF1193938.1 phenylacetate--CoA ligase family protein [Mangrovimonas futianensis]